jgi:hypothetical protein
MRNKKTSMLMRRNNSSKVKETTGDFIIALHERKEPL